MTKNRLTLLIDSPLHYSWLSTLKDDNAAIKEDTAENDEKNVGQIDQVEKIKELKVTNLFVSYLSLYLLLITLRKVSLPDM